MTSPTNPLVAERVDSTGWYSGVGIAESIADLVHGVESGSWIEGTIGGIGTSLEALGTIVDPLGSVASWGVAWLIEHVGPLSSALEWLAGDPDQIAAFALTWRNVAGHAQAQAGGLREAVWHDVPDWVGPSADAYRDHAAATLGALLGLGSAASGIGTVVEGAGLLVALVREMVRDLIADFVAVLAVRLPLWLAQEGLTFGLATPLVVAQVGALAAKWAARISRLLLALVNSLRRLLPILRRLDELIGNLTTLLRGLERTSTWDRGGHRLPRARDRDGDHRPDGLDPDGDGDGRLDDLDGDGRVDIPPPIRDGPTLPTKPMDPSMRYETDPERLPFHGKAVKYLTDAEREEYRLFVRDGLIYRTDGELFDSRGSATFWGGRDSDRAIFVMDENGNLYASKFQASGEFHHSSLVAGGPVAGAGELHVEDGRLIGVTDHSGHYTPTRRMTWRVASTLAEQGVSMDGVDFALEAPAERRRP
jgi:hypothetical protein